MMLGRPLFTGESSWGQMYAALPGPGINLGLGVQDLRFRVWGVRLGEDVRHRVRASKLVKKSPGSGRSGS